MKKKVRWFGALAAVLMLVCALAFSGCAAEEEKHVVSVYRAEDEIVVNYSDGTQEIIGTVEHDKLTAQELYEEYKSVYGDDLTYAEFLELYLSTPAENTSVIHQCLLSSVKFYTEFYETTSAGIMQTGKRTGLYTGSGVIYRIDADYTYMITNYHVIYSQYANSDNGGKTARKIACYLYGSESDPYATGQTTSGYTTYEYGNYTVDCEYVGGSVAHDIAIVRAKTSEMMAVNPDIRSAEFADSYRVGQTAIAIGNPEGEGISVSEGIVSVDNEYISLNIDGTARSYRSIRIDTAIYSGNSGGGLFDSEGKLIGITNAGDGEDQSINFAVPLEVAQGAAENILYWFGEGSGSSVTLKKPMLGVTVTSENSRFVYDDTLGYGTIREDIAVQSVESGSIAKAVGVQEGDVLTELKLGDTVYALDRNFDIADALLNARPDMTLTVTFTRGGTQMSGTYTFKTSDFTAVE